MFRVRSTCQCVCPPVFAFICTWFYGICFELGGGIHKFDGQKGEFTPITLNYRFRDGVLLLCLCHRHVCSSGW